MKKIIIFSVAAILLIGIVIAVARRNSAPPTAAPPPSNGLMGTIVIDGSSTVFPITEAVVEEFGRIHPKVIITVGISGTGGGFKKFCQGHTDISNASRSISETELQTAAGSGVEYVEFSVAFDGLSVLVNHGNTFVDYLTVEELRQIWMKDSPIKTWADVRASWPGEAIKLFAPGTDSGTHDYFREAVLGHNAEFRADYVPSEDDWVLAKGVVAEPFALGFFGYAYYAQNKDKLKVVPIQPDGGTSPVTPSPQTIYDRSYRPLSRPLFLYVNNRAMKRPEVRAFLRFYFENAERIIARVQYVPLEPQAYTRNLALLEGIK